MQNKKNIVFLVPDGVGVKNFILLNNLEKSDDYNIKYWSHIPYKDTIVINNRKIHKNTSLYQDALLIKRMNEYAKKFKDSNFKLYLKRHRNKDLKSFFKNIFRNILTYKNNLQETILFNETKTSYFNSSKEYLLNNKVDFLITTNQRSVYSISPLQAAKELGIKTGTFIFSWDNLPKGFLFVEVDYYFVWSEFMKQEICKYFPKINPENVFVVGTPQFNNHFDNKFDLTFEEFIHRYNLPNNKKFICYSGDDVLTSPNDPIYLEDLNKTVQKLNEDGHNYHILFRRCPVDRSNRFDLVLSKNKDTITPLDPIWDFTNQNWDSRYATYEDLILQTNILKHSIGVFNLGSSMVFDAISNNKLCGYLNYDCNNSTVKSWTVDKIYKYQHFKSMVNLNAVIWINSPQDFEKAIVLMQNNDSQINAYAKLWFDKVVQQPANKSYERLIHTILKLINHECN